MYYLHARIFWTSAFKQEEEEKNDKNLRKEEEEEEWKTGIKLKT